ncbi:MAG: trypsin-like peptidase domain-containing protein [Actinomycetes bacterium]
MNRTRLPILIVLGSAAVAGLVGFASGTTARTASLSTGSSLQSDFVRAFKHVSPSVVQIQTTDGLGSGIVFDRKGDIVTNNHVVGTAKTFTVTTSTGKQLNGTLVGTFPQDDLAVIKVDGAGLHPAAFADSGKLQVGDIAMAIGNPLGLSSSVTEGIVSALNRQEPEGNGYVLRNAIQTSAAINPGNSGGALVDISARVIGIPTLAATDPQLGGAAAGIGFAIPSNVVTDIAGQLIRYGHVVTSHRAYLGVSIADTGSANGVYISALTAGTPAATAGLKVGQLITAINGTATPTSTELGTALAALKPGQVITIAYRTQAGTVGSVKLTLGEFPGATG